MRVSMSRNNARGPYPGREGQAVPHHPGPLPDEGRPGAGASTSARRRTSAPGPGRTSTRRAAEDRRICDWIDEVADIDFLPADSEVDALLMEARLIKDIQPKYNRDLKDDKTFPYLQITTGEDFPRVNFTREPLDRGVKLYGPFPRAKSLRGAIQVLQKIFKFRTCSLDIEEDDPRWRWFRPCLLHSINQCTAPCNLRIDRESYRNDIRRLQLFLDGKKDVLVSRRWRRRCARRARASSSRRPRGSATRSRRCRRSTSGATSPSTPSPRSSTSTRDRGSRGSRRSSSSTRSRARSTAWTSPTSAARRWSARW